MINQKYQSTVHQTKIYEKQTFVLAFSWLKLEFPRENPS